MFHVKVNRDERTELHEQVAAEIRRAIADGEARAGERLPPARTSQPCSALTRTRCCARFVSYATRVYWTSAVGVE